MSVLQLAGNASRRSAKALIEGSLAYSGLPALARARRRADVLVLAYHNVVPNGEHAVGDQSLHISQRLFARQLDVIRRTHEIVPLASIFDEAPGARPRAVVTFDDAYAGAVSAGVDELVRRGIPATIFVAPAFVGGGTFWWDEIADPVSGFVPPEVRSHCLGSLRGLTADVLDWADARGIARNTVPAHQRVATAAELSGATANRGISLGSHTWSHANLQRLAGAELATELSRPLAWLRERFSAVVPWLSYPYGLFSREVEEAAQRAGYSGAFRVDGGWIGRAPQQRFALARLNIPAGLSLRGFELRAAGLVGAR